MAAHTADPTAASLEAYWMPFTANRQFKAKPRMLARASGMYYETPEGRRILDGTAGLWCVNAGHGRKEITRAVAEQLEVMDYAPPFQIGHPAAFELANAVVRIAPKGLDHVFFTNSGSESVDTALKIALAYHRVKGDAARVRLLGRERGYHGVGFGGISVGGMVANRKAWPTAMIPGVDHLVHTHDIKRNAFTRGLAGARRGARGRPRTPGGAARCVDHCRRHRRAHRRLHRRGDAAAGLSQAPARDLRQARHPADLRRSDHRLRAHGLGVRRAGIRRDARHDHLRQGTDQRRDAHGRRAGVEENLRRVHAGPAGRHRTVPRLHLLSASDRLRRGARDARHLRAREAAHARQADGARRSRKRCTSCADCRMSSTSATTGWWPASSWSRSPARPARALSACTSSVSSAGC